MKWLIPLLFLSSIGRATITSDLYSYSTATTANVNVTHTVTGTNTILLMGLAAQYPAPTISAMNYGGYPLTPIVSTGVGGTSQEKRGASSLYYLINPPTGLQNLSVTLTGGGPYKVVWVHSFAGVDQDIPISYSFTTSGQLPIYPSMSLTGDANDMLVSVAQVSFQNVLTKSGTLETQTFTASTTGISVCSTRRVLNTGLDAVMGYTCPTGTAYWTAVGVALANSNTLGEYINTYQAGKWSMSLTGQPPYTVQGTVAMSTTHLNVWPNGTWTVSQTGQPPVVIKISDTETGMYIARAILLTMSLTGQPPISTSYPGSCTPVLGSLLVTTAGATMIIPSNTKELRYHISGDSGSTAYVYASFVSINQAAADQGSSCGYQTFGVGAGIYPLNVPCHIYTDMNLPGPVNMYWYSRGGCDVHWLQMRKI